MRLRFARSEYGGPRALPTIRSPGTARPGTASITSTRPACPTPNSGSQSGVAECGAILGFRVSVRVS
jgi:hypothetical protein